jgi:hypothetical protein
MVVECKFRGAEKAGNRWECSCPYMRTVDPRGVTANDCDRCPVPGMRLGGAAAQKQQRPLTEEEKTARAARQTEADAAFRRGPGGQLKALLAELGLEPSSGCQCVARAQQMNAWGIDGCLDNRETIMGWLAEEAEKASWGGLLYGGVKAVLGKGINPFNPYNSLLAEALRRAAAAQPKEARASS